MKGGAKGAKGSEGSEGGRRERRGAKGETRAMHVKLSLPDFHKCSLCWECESADLHFIVRCKQILTILILGLISLGALSSEGRGGKCCGTC